MGDDVERVLFETVYFVVMKLSELFH